MFITNRGGQRLFDIQGTPKDPANKGSFISKGTVRFSPRLCEAAYRLRYRLTTIKGAVTENPYPARVHGGRLDGIATHCPFAGLPRRHFTSMHVRASIEGKSFLSFVARPFKRSDPPFALLKVLHLNFSRPYVPAGLLRVWFRVRYASHKSHTVKFMADTDVPLPRG